MRFFNVKCGPDRTGHEALSACAIWKTSYPTEHVWQQRTFGVCPQACVVR